MTPLEGKIFNSPDEVIEETLRFGFLPFFRNEIHGFSIEEHTPSELWFSDVNDGPWEWKGPIVRTGKVAYAKLLRNKAAYVSPQLLPHLINVRRSSKQLTYDEERVLQAIVANESMLSTEIRTECGFGPHGSCAADRMLLASINGPDAPRASLDTVLTRLQMAGRIVVSDFEYNIDKKGRPYGWGIARYSTPEILYADWFSLPDATPAQSHALLSEKLLALFPSIGTKIANKLIG